MVAIIAVVTVKKAAVIFQKLQRFIDRMNVRLRESITGVRVIRAFGKEQVEQDSLDEAFSAYADSAIKVNWLFATFDCSSFFIMNSPRSRSSGSAATAWARTPCRSHRSLRASNMPCSSCSSS